MGKEEEEREKEMKILYLNVGRAEGVTHTVLQVAVEEGAAIVITAEPWGENKRRKQQPGYEVAYESKDIVVYRLQGSHIRVRGEGSWALIGEEVAAAYLRPRLNRTTVKSRLHEMIRKGATTVIGDPNCHGNGKDRMLSEWIEEEEMMDIGTAEYTHRYGLTHKCIIDRVLTKGGGRPWKIEKEWQHSSDHAIIGLKKDERYKRKQVKRINWEAVQEYVRDEEEGKKVCGKNLTYVGEAYEKIVQLKEEKWERTVTIVGKSKPWWKKEWKNLRKRAKHSRAARKELRREIRKAKREMWEDWISKGKEVWDIVRVCKNPFGMRERCGIIKDKEGREYSTKEEKKRAFTEHNLITDGEVE